MKVNLSYSRSLNKNEGNQTSSSPPVYSKETFLQTLQDLIIQLEHRLQWAVPRFIIAPGDLCCSFYHLVVELMVWSTTSGLQLHTFQLRHLESRQASGTIELVGKLPDNSTSKSPGFAIFGGNLYVSSPRWRFIKANVVITLRVIWVFGRPLN